MIKISEPTRQRVQASVSMTQDKLGYIAGQLRGLTYQQVVDMVRTILETALYLTKQDLIKWVRAYVPKRTGQLQDNLIEHLEASKMHQGNQLAAFLRFGTDIWYAPFVNKMPERMVRHSGGPVVYQYYYSGPTKITLNDPLAIGKFMGTMIRHGRERFRHHLRQVRLNITGSVGVSAKPVADQMKVVIP